MAIAVDDVCVLGDEDGAVDVSEEVKVSEKGEILRNDVDIVEGFVGEGRRTVIYVETLWLRQELLEIAAENN